MSSDGDLEVAAGFATDPGPRADNQDFGGVHIGSPTEQRLHGVVAVIADGVSGSKGGRIASELAARSFIDGYLSANPLEGIAAAGVSSLRGFNRWLHARGKSDPAMTGAATTFTALVLRGREAVALHVGDSRAWHYRDGVLTRLTEDHTLSRQGLNHVLYRAVGIEQDVKLDVRAQPLKPHDRLLLTSDGVHGVLDEFAMGRLLNRRRSPDADAKAIVDAAIQAGARDNATAVLIDVVRVAAIDRDALGAEAEGLPILDTPKPGDNVDGYRLGRLLSDGKYTRIFLGQDGTDPTPLVIKFPKPTLLSEQGARASFLRESFIGRRIDSPHVGKTLSVEPGRQSRLYIVQPYYEGQTLHARLAEEGGFPIQSGVATAIALARGVEALHRRRITHRDIKPDNVILEKSGGVKLIDLGVARLPGMAGFGAEEFSEAEAPGTPGFMAPEMYAGEAGDAATDQFALGVTLYRLFTGTHYPFGEVEAGARPRFDRPTRPTFHRADMPAWLEVAIMRALAVDPTDRFADVQELITVLESGSAIAAPVIEPPSLIERYPVRFWQGVSAILAALLFLSVVMR